MADINCPHCAKPIDDALRRCPNCHEALTARTRTPITFGKVLWVLAFIGALWGLADLLLTTPQSAPQQAAMGAMAGARAAVPYVLARAWQALTT